MVGAPSAWPALASVICKAIGRCRCSTSTAISHQNLRLSHPTWRNHSPARSSPASHGQPQRFAPPPPPPPPSLHSKDSPPPNEQQQQQPLPVRHGHLVARTMQNCPRPPRSSPPALSTALSPPRPPTPKNTTSTLSSSSNVSNPPVSPANNPPL